MTVRYNDWGVVVVSTHVKLAPAIVRTLARFDYGAIARSLIDRHVPMAGWTRIGWSAAL